MLFKSVGEDFGEDGCREVLETKVVKIFDREVRKKSVVEKEKCWRRVFNKNDGKE